MTRPVSSLLPVLLLLLFTTGCPAAAAGMVDTVAADFQPLSGYVIMPAEGELLLDLGMAKGVQEGELFSVVTPGEKIVHPVTKEVLGALDKVKATVQVSRVQSGYSFARPLNFAAQIESGDPVRRYLDVPAIFWDYAGDGEPVFAELKAALLHLKWQGYDIAQAARPQAPAAPQAGGPLLIFILHDDRLEVRDAEFRLLHHYPRAGKKQPASQPAAAVGRDGEPAAVQGGSTTEEHWVGPEMEGRPVGIEVGDMDGDGRLEVAMGFTHRLELGRVADGRYTPLTTLDLGTGQDVVALDGADLDGDGRMELYLTAAASGSLASLLVECRADRCRVERTGIPWYFRTVSLPGEGPVLLAQRMGSLENDFSGPIFRVVRSGGELSAGATLPVPGAVSLFGFSAFHDAGGRGLLARLSAQGSLQVLGAGGESVWKSGESFGRSEVCIQRQDSSTAGSDVRCAMLPPRLAGSETGEILLPVNERSSIFPWSDQFRKSRVVVMKWDGRRLRESWQTQPQDGYLADFRLADVDNDGVRELVTALGQTLGGWKREDRAVMVVYKIPGAPTTPRQP